MSGGRGRDQGGVAASRGGDGPGWAPVDGERERRVRHLIAVDADAVIRRLAKRRDEMVALFSRRRDRSVFLRVVASSLPSAGFQELALLTPGEQLATGAFCEALEELRWYLEHTDDMPQTLLIRMGPLVHALGERHAALIAVLGAPDGIAGPVIEAPVRAARELGLRSARRGAGRGPERR